jgi:5'(3')-deoxyribonucleotidase
MDEVLNLMSKHAIDHYNRDFDDDFDWKDNKSWWWDDAPKADRRYFEELMNSEGFFYDTEPQEDGIYYMQKLIGEGHDVKILTFPLWNGICAKEKEQWIRKHIPKFNIENTFMVKEKWLLAGPGMVLLDDNMDNLIKWSEYGGIAVAYNHTFNQEWDGLRVYSHKEFYDLVKELEKMENMTLEITWK